MAVTLSRNSPRSSQRACAGEARLLWLSADLACVTGPVFFPRSCWKCAKEGGNERVGGHSREDRARLGNRGKTDVSHTLLICSWPQGSRGTITGRSSGRARLPPGLAGRCPAPVCFLEVYRQGVLEMDALNCPGRFYSVPTFKLFIFLRLWVCFYPFILRNCLCEPGQP